MERKDKTKHAPKTLPLLPAPTNKVISLPQPQLTETSARYHRKVTGGTAIAEALRESEQLVSQLLAERDAERAEVAMADTRAGHATSELASLKEKHAQVYT